MLTHIRTLVLGFFYLTNTSDVLRYSDIKPSQQSGLYFENRGLMIIITNLWDMTAFLDLANYKFKGADISTFNKNSTFKCDQSTRLNLSDTHCSDLLDTAAILPGKINKKKKFEIFDL